MAGIVSPVDLIVYCTAATFGLRLGVSLLLRWMWRCGIDAYAERYENDPDRCDDREFRVMQGYASTYGASWRERYYGLKALRALEGRGLVMVDGRRVAGGVPKRKGRGRRKHTADVRKMLKETEKNGYQLNWRAKYRRK